MDFRVELAEKIETHLLKFASCCTGGLHMSTASCLRSRVTWCRFFTSGTAGAGPRERNEHLWRGLGDGCAPATGYRSPGCATMAPCGGSPTKSQSVRISPLAGVAESTAAPQLYGLRGCGEAIGVSSPRACACALQPRLTLYAIAMSRAERKVYAEADQETDS